MSFSETMVDALVPMYEALGVQAVYTHNATSKEIYIVKNGDYTIEYEELPLYKAMTRDVESIALGDTLVVEGQTYTISNFKLSDDGLETYIGV